jgi:hypothetical protein
VQDHLLLFKRRIAFSSDPRAEDFLTQTSFSQDKSHAETPVRRMDGCAGNSQTNTKQSRGNQGSPEAYPPQLLGEIDRTIKPEGGHLSPFGAA